MHTLALILLLAAPAEASITGTLDYHGFLTDKATGLPADGPRDMRFRLYDAREGGALLYTDTRCGDGSGAGVDGPAVQVSEGRYAAAVGAYDGSIPGSVFYDRPGAWLEVSADPDGGCDSFEPLLPRSRLQASAYAFDSLHASTASAADPVFEADTVSPLESTANGALTVSTHVYISSGKLGVGKVPEVSLDVVGDVRGSGLLDVPGNLEIVHPKTDSRLIYSPSVFTCAPGNWCEASGWGVNRLGSAGRNTYCSGDADCSSNYVELKLDDNEYRAVLFSHLDWDDSYIISVYLSFDAGVSYAFHKAVYTRRIETDSTPYNSTIRTAATNLPLGADVRVRLVASKGRMYFEGFGLSKLNLPEEDHKPLRMPTRLTAQNISDGTCDTDAACGPTALAARKIDFVKVHTDTEVRVEYTDNMRVYGAGATRCCRYYVYFNGASCPSGEIDTRNYANSNDNAHRMRSMVGFCGGLSPGEYNIQIYIANCPGYNARCVTGWNNTTFTLEAEEVR